MDWQINLINEFFGNILLGKIIKNSRHIPAIHNIDRSYQNKENPILLNMFRNNSIFTSTWHQVNKSFLSELDEIELQEIEESYLIDSIWKSLLFDNQYEQGRWMKFKDLYFGFDYDGLIYTVSDNVTYTNFVPPPNCPYIGKFYLDIRCRFYYNQTMGNISTVVFNPQIFYTDVTPLTLQALCQRRLRYQNADPNSSSKIYSLLCLTLDLSILPSYFQNFEQNSKLQMLLNPEYLTVIYNSQYKLNRTEIVNVEQIETKYLIDQTQASYFINNITQNNQFLLKNQSYVDLKGFNSQDNQYMFQYNRNGTECFVIKNIITFVNQVPKYEFQRKIDPAPRFSVKNAFLFLDILSKQKMEMYSQDIQEQIKQYNMIFTYSSLIITWLFVFIQIKYSLILANQFLKPVIHLTGILNKIIAQNKEDKQLGQLNNFKDDSPIRSTLEDNKKYINYIEELENIDYDSDSLKDECFSYDTQQLYNSFQNLFKVLTFINHNIYKDNESESLLNLNVQISHFNQFRNHRALGVCYNNIGVIHYNCGRFQESIENFQKSIVFAKYELGFYDHESDGFQIVKNISEHVNQQRQHHQNSYESEQEEEDFQQPMFQRQSIQKKTKYDIQITSERINLFWNLYNRMLNQIKAMRSHIIINKQFSLYDILYEQVLELLSVSHLFLPPSNKRDMLNCYTLLISYKLQNNLQDCLKILDKFMKLYLKKFQSKNFWSDCQNNLQRNENKNNLDQHQKLFSYQNSIYKLLQSPIQNSKHMKYLQKSIISKSYKDCISKILDRNAKNNKNPAQISNLNYQENPKVKIQASQINLDLLKVDNLASPTNKRIKKVKRQFFQVKKILNQFKMSHYEFSSDIFFQYYALEQAYCQIELKNYSNAGLLLTNLFEKCFFYLPHLKKQALATLDLIFKKANIKNLELLEICQKYNFLPYANFKVCVIQACESKFSQFKSFAVQSDLINDILFKDKDQFGSLSYSFEEQLYFQQIQFLNLKTLKSRISVFENILKKQFSKQWKCNKKNEKTQKADFNQNNSIQRTNSIIKLNKVLQINSEFNDSSQKNILNDQYQYQDQIYTPTSQQSQYNSNFFRFEDTQTGEYKNKESKYFQKQTSYLSQKNLDSIIKSYALSPNSSSFLKYKNGIKVDSPLNYFTENNFFNENNQSSFNIPSKLDQINFYSRNEQHKVLNSTENNLTQQNNNNIIELQNQTNLVSKFAKHSFINESLSFLNADVSNNFNDNNQLLYRSNETNNEVYLNSYSHVLINKNQLNLQSKEKNINSVEQMKNINKKSSLYTQNSPSNKFKQVKLATPKQAKLIQMQKVSEYPEEQQVFPQSANNSFIQKPKQTSTDIPNSSNKKQNKSHKTGEQIFHHGIKAALKQFILNTDEKLDYYLTQKKFVKNQQQQYQTYLLYITDQQLEIKNEFLLNELCSLLINLNVELLILTLNQQQSLQEYTDFRNIFQNQKSVITFFNTEQKLLQYIYNSREHVKNYLFPMILEQF
ncbi:hypothetical protein ABPG74_020472 [Tetrahymena malaccensis]